ncbi:MAG: hypothetical protein QOC63_3575 [Mycobacterium sp.]|nr:hypothetical protein [Mycobacterium sp.]
MKKILGTVAVFAIIAPNALLAAQVAQATPYDPTTTVAPAPVEGHSPAGPQQAPAYTPTQQAPPIPTQTVPAYTPPPVTQAPVQTYEPPVTTYTPPPVETPTRTVPAYTPTVAPTTENPVTTQAPRSAIDTTVPPTTTQRATTAVSVPSAAATTSTPAPAATTPASAAVTTGAVVPANPTPSSNPTSGVPLPAESGAPNTPQSSSAAVSTTLRTTAIVTGGTTVTAVVPSTSSSPAVTPANQLVVPQPSAVPVKDAAVIEAAKVAPAVVVDPAAPPAPPVNVTNITNINTQITNIQQVNIQNNTNITVNNWRPDRWDYVDYDPYRRPIFYNPCGEDVRYRYYYDGDYREVWVPAGGRTVLNIAIAGVFPFVALGSSFVSAGYFNGGAWIPPYDGYVGPPPPDWHPYQPVYYDNASVNVAAANKSIFVNRVTVVGHDDTLPAGQQDSFMLDGTTLARGQISPDGKAINLATAQKTPGVGPVTNGVDLVNLAQPMAPARDNTPYYVSAALALAALMGGVFWWVWHRPKAGHAANGFDPPTGPIRRPAGWE